MSRIENTLLGIVQKNKGVVPVCKTCGKIAEFFCNREPGSQEYHCNHAFCNDHVRTLSLDVHRCADCDFENFTP